MSLTSAAGKRGYTRCSELTRLWIVSAFSGNEHPQECEGYTRALLAGLEQVKADRLSRADGCVR